MIHKKQKTYALNMFLSLVLVQNGIKIVVIYSPIFGTTIPFSEPDVLQMFQSSKRLQAFNLSLISILDTAN